MLHSNPLNKGYYHQYPIDGDLLMGMTPKSLAHIVEKLNDPVQGPTANAILQGVAYAIGASNTIPYIPTIEVSEAKLTATDNPYNYHTISNLPVITTVQPSLKLFEEHFSKANYAITQSNLLSIATSVMSGKPILVEGPPGTGKTTLALEVARALGLDPDNPNHFMHIFCTPDIKKENILYEWNEAKRLMDLQLAKAAQAEHLYNTILQEAYSYRYLSIMPLLKATLLPYRTVVLIDEIDKTFPEFDVLLLDILENNSFVIPEIGRVGNPHTPKSERPVFILTSNAQRDLASPLRRRASYVYYTYLNEPVEAKILQKKGDVTQEEALIAARFFRQMRTHKECKLLHLPSTAEAIETVKAIKLLQLPVSEDNLLRFHTFWLKQEDDINLFYATYKVKLQTLCGELNA